MVTTGTLDYPGPTADQLADYIGTGASAGAAVERALATAKAELADVLEGRFKDPSEDTYNELVLEVGAELYARRDSPTGSSQYADFSTGQPVRGPRDPFNRVWPILRRYVTGF